MNFHEEVIVVSRCCSSLKLISLWSFESGNEDMMKVVKPMALSVMHFLPVMEKNDLTMAQLFEVCEEICGEFDRCFSDGVINDKVMHVTEIVICLSQPSFGLNRRITFERYRMTALEELCDCFSERHGSGWAMPSPSRTRWNLREKC